MTMAYLSSFDLDTIGAGSVTLSTSGESDIAIDLSTYEHANLFGTMTSKFNHKISSSMYGFGPFANNKIPAMPTSGLIDALTFAFRDAAADASWSDPNSIFISLDPSTWLVTFFYDNDFTSIAFANTETRRLFGFGGNFSGSSSAVTGAAVPKYILIPVVDGASSATPVIENQDSYSSSAYSGTGRSYGLSRSTVRQARSWTQQFETKSRTYRRFASAIPNEFTYQELFENSRGGLPFGVYGGFGDDQYEAYVFAQDADAFHPYPAQPGSSNRFHIPFNCHAVATS